MIPPFLLAECYAVPFWQKRLCPETPDRPLWQAPEPDGLSAVSSMEPARSSGPWGERNDGRAAETLSGKTLVPE
ncbi:hypothetical protein GX408_14540 [bacterium]|nr:hypothetical protein [bacterium]